MKVSLSCPIIFLLSGAASLASLPVVRSSCKSSRSKAAGGGGRGGGSHPRFLGGQGGGAVASSSSSLLSSSTVRGDDGGGGGGAADPHVYHRKLFQVGSPFEYYNEECRADCFVGSGEEEGGGAADGSGTLAPYLNPCPDDCGSGSGGGPRYASQHCSSCCYGGASSIKVRWHGCPGTASFPSVAEALDDCGGGNSANNAVPGYDPRGVRLVDCGCYDAYLAAARSGGGFEVECTLHETMEFTVPDDGVRGYDICFVSVDPDVSAEIDLTRPLPATIGFKFFDEDGGDSFTTYFDTTCAAPPNDGIHALPIFPGYGKIPDSCPRRGFVDLRRAGNAPLPEEIPHLDDGELDLLDGMYWIEFIDGTSVGFWPSSANDAASTTGLYYFDGTFGKWNINGICF